MDKERAWTIFIAQDKHLDYNWCGTQAEIEVRMAGLLDGYLDLAETQRSHWNMDSTWWAEVYQRQRGNDGVQRLSKALQSGWLGCAANIGVIQWGLLNTELSIEAFAKSLDVAEMAGTGSDVALVEENPGMPWSVAQTVTACGIPFLGRGIYDLRAKSYNAQRQPFPLFWWEAPDGQRVLVHWDLYDDTGAWGGYAEAFQLARLAGEKWNALELQSIADRNTDAVFAKRVAYIEQTVARYQAYGQNYPVSSILLLGTGWDNWVVTEDYAKFIQRFNAEYTGNIQLVDALYADYFHAVLTEITDRQLEIPVLRGSFGICWEEWAAHLAGYTRQFREASRMLVHAQAGIALSSLGGEVLDSNKIALQQAIAACLRFAEHDFGGVDRRTAAISAGVRAGAAAEARTLLQALSPVRDIALATLDGDAREEAHTFIWNGWQVCFNAEHGGVVSLVDDQGYEWVPQECGCALGDFLHTYHQESQLPDSVIPDAIPGNGTVRLDHIMCRRAENGIEIKTWGQQSDFSFATRWFFHERQRWIDVTYELADGWTERPQSVQFCFPVALEAPSYTYDMAGTILKAGAVQEGGDDLPGANPVLYALQNFAQVVSTIDSNTRGVILLSPDAPLVQFGIQPRNLGGRNFGDATAGFISMPMMNLTRNDWQFNQGGLTQWQFRYRLVWTNDASAQAPTPLTAIRESQHFAVPPFLQVPGEKPVIPDCADLCIDFPGGPVTAFKLARDGQSVTLRLWNVFSESVTGTLKLPPCYDTALLTDSLERPLVKLDVQRGQVRFTAPSRSLVTLVLQRRPNLGCVSLLGK